MVKMSKYMVAGLVGVTAVTACERRSSVTGPSPVNPGATVTPAVSIAQSYEGPLEEVVAPSTIVIAGQAISVDGAMLHSGGAPLMFADLKPGARSRVAAQRDGSGVHASDVEVLDAVGVPAQFSGPISGMSWSGQTFLFRLGDHLIRGDERTQVIHGSGTTSPSSLQDGDQVALDGLRRTSYVYATRVAEQESAPPSSTVPPTPTVPPTGPSNPPTPPPNPTPTVPTPAPDEIVLGGILGAVSGVCPLITFPVGGRVFVTNTSTTYVGGDCSSLKAGSSVEARGTQAGDVVAAREVTVR